MFSSFSFKRPAVKYHGLKNQGATCYLNSVLQVLFMTKGFREAVRRFSENGDVSFDTHLSILFSDLEDSETSTEVITENLGISSGSIQGDAAECFEKIMNNIKCEKATEMFKIWLAHKNICCQCQTETSSDEQFWHLPLELEGESYYPFKVVDGLKAFFRESRVTGMDQLYCENCGSKSDSHDKFEMKTHPEFVTLLLKRFKFDNWMNRYMKNDRKVDFPDKITIQSQKYELYAFVEHSGYLKAGHYTVTIKSEEDGKWYYFNDTTVTLLDYQPLQVDPSYSSRGAYLLFYRKEKKASSGDEASPPAACKPGTRGVADPSGIEEKEEEDVRKLTEREGKRATADEESGEKQKKILAKEKAASEEKDRITAAVEQRDERKKQTGVEEEATNVKAADDRQIAGGHKRGDKLQTIYDLSRSSVGKTTSETSDTRHEKENGEVQKNKQPNEESPQSKSSFCQDVEGQDTAAFNNESHDDGTAKDETSGQDRDKRERGEETIGRGDDENQIPKQTDGRIHRSEFQLSLKCSSSNNHPLNKSEEREEIMRDDGQAQTRKDSRRYRGQSVDVPNGMQTEPEEDIKEGMRDSSVKRQDREGEQMRENMQNEHRKWRTIADKYDSKPLEVESLSQDLGRLELNDSPPTQNPQRGIIDTQPSPSTSYPCTGYFYRQSPHEVPNLWCGNCNSVVMVMPTDRHSLTQTFIPPNYPGFYYGMPPVTGNICPSYLHPASVQTTHPMYPPFTISNRMAEQPGTRAEAAHSARYSPDRREMYKVLYYNPKQQY
ncbi:unnamed protein product [Ophioblennius macclurei]